MKLTETVSTKFKDFRYAYKNETSTKEKMSTKEILSVGMVEFGKNASSVLMISYLNVYLTMVLGIEATTIGLLSTFAVIISYIRSPIMAPIMDNTKTKVGRFKPYIVVCLPLATLLSAAFFYNPFSSDQTMKIIWVYALYLTWDTIYYIGNTAWGNIQMCITRNDGEKKRYMAISRGLNVISGFIPSTMPILMDICPLIGISMRALFLSMSLIMCVIGFASTMLAKNIQERVLIPKREKLLKNIRMVFKNKNTLIMQISALGSFFAYVGGISGTYVLIYCYGAYSWQSVIWGFAGCCAWVFLFMTKRIFNRFSPKTIMILYNLMGVISFLVLYVCGYGRAWYFIAILIGTRMFAAALEYVSSVAGGIFSTNIWDHYEWKYGIRNEATTGLVFSWLTIPISVCSPLIYGVIYTKIGFVAGADTQSQTTMDWLFFLFTICGALNQFFSLLPYFFIKLDKNKMEYVRRELKLRADKKAAIVALGGNRSMYDTLHTEYKDYFIRKKPDSHISVLDREESCVED